MSNRLKGFTAIPGLLTVLLSACTSSQNTPENNQQLERFIRPAVITIVDGCRGRYAYRDGSNLFDPGDLYELGVGSGYFVNPTGYIVTNAHVTDYANRGEQGEKDCKDKLFNRQFIGELASAMGKRPEDILKNRALFDKIKRKSKLSNDSFQLIRWAILPNQSRQDPLKFQVTKPGDPKNRDISILKVEGIDNAPVLLLGDSDKVQNTDSILVFGYPNDNNIPGVMSLDSAFKPSVTLGSVSNKLALINNAPILQISASVAPGNSGGPVVNSKGDVIGMVTFRKASYIGSGISNAIPAKTIKAVLDEAGVKNEQGRTDELYRKGLDYYWQKNYTDATSQFRQVQGLFRRHSEVEELILDSEAKRAKQGPNFWPWLAIAAIVAAVPALAFILYRRGLVPVGDGVVGSVLDRMTGFWPPASMSKSERPPAFLDSSPQTRVLAGSQPLLELETRLSSVPLQFYLNQDIHRIGRDPEWSDIEIPEQGWEVISRRHAVLRREGANYRIFDGDGRPSSNGVWMDGKRIDPVTGFLLTNGVQLQFGNNPQTQVTLTYFNPTGKAVPKPTYVE